LFFQGSARQIYYQGPYEGHRIFDPASYSVLLQVENGQSFPYVLGSNYEIDSLLTQNYLESQGYSSLDITQKIDSTLQIVRNTHQGHIGNEAYVPMEWNFKKYTQLKLIYKFSPLLKLKYNILSDRVTYQDYDRAYKLNPDGNLTRYRMGLTHLLQLHHSLNERSFYTLSFTHFNKSYFHETYSEEDQGLLIHSDFGVTEPYSFKTGGTNNNLFSRQTKTTTAKFDLTSQYTHRHLMKFGFEFRQHDLQYENINLQAPENKIAINPLIDGGYLINPRILPDSTIHASSYENRPYEMSTYIQDKIEYDDLIINAGVRFDYFDPKVKIPIDPSDPSIYNPIRPENRYHDLNENGVQDDGEPAVNLLDRQAYWYKNTDAKWKISPRIGFSFPISDRGVFHFSYGHFFQIPRFELLYQNPDYDLGQGTGNVGVVGNPNLRPEKTISGELGLQQQLNHFITLDITGYFRDIRDLTGTRAEEIIIFGGSAKYSRFENSDFAYIRGIVMNFKINNLYGWNGDINYTYQIARGTASDPEQARASITGGKLPEIHLIPLNWDQTHTLSLAMMYSQKIWGGSLIAQLGSGLPYTPESTDDISTLIVNSSRKPITWNVDFRSYYQVNIFGESLTVFFRVKNLFDHLNHNNVYNDSGRANETVQITRALKTNPSEAINSISDWFNNETFYSQPRRVELGINYDF
jgi:outer membrane receptor for ferrienterochelin and colicin